MDMDVDEEQVVTGRKRKMADNGSDEEIDFKRQNTRQTTGLKRKHDNDQEENRAKVNTTNQNRPTLDVLRGRRDAYYTQKFNNNENAGRVRKTRTRRRHKKRHRSSKRRHSKTLSKH